MSLFKIADSSESAIFVFGRVLFYFWKVIDNLIRNGSKRRSKTNESKSGYFGRYHMPKIIIYRFLQFFFYSYDLQERLHLHVIRGKKGYQRAAKIWIENGIEAFEQGELTNSEINTALEVIKGNLPQILEHIERFKNGEKVEILNIYSL
ncbi:DUF4160 domain-containing protein [Runella sp.]|uniref:DUF4160 domain-containing protein n=2 Tax=Runella sp. TaxID=1960881 RepID=UPI00262F3E6B|nr:DUF4160 domain-containing protein [Runella sp.]